MPIIVLEGPDGSGKTTVAQAISELYPGLYESLRCGPPSPDTEPYWQYDGIIDQAEMLENDGKLVVIDRLHVGELVYGRIFRGRSRLSIEQAQTLDDRLARLGAVRAAFMPSTRVLLERQHQRDGGKPDAKSGAGVSDTQMIRAQYRWVLSFLPGWIDVDTNRYPGVIARDLAERAFE
jgi:thymidylate kinase